MKRIIIIAVVIKVLLLIWYLNNRNKDSSIANDFNERGIDYESLSNTEANIVSLENCKSEYPFAKWRNNDIEHDMKQYSQVNCEAVEIIFDQLIADLKLLPKEATAKEKVLLFKDAISSLNTINEKIDDLIETGEREDLCELMDQISVAAGLEVEDYADGEGIASEWREW